ncbi:TIGR00296 family protein [Candidatus Woesearchaeota archaeon]|nr:TIGR00296 family protein [Candidatus Woesearchaeota archaeon]
MIKAEQAKKLIRAARDSISSYLSGRGHEAGVIEDELKKDKELSEAVGVFVTLNRKGELRGCIGFPEGIYPLYEGVIKAARSAAFSDPRFMAVGKDELDDISIEISVLTKPKKIDVKKAEDYIGKVKIGRDGLIIRSMHGSGLLLPQVAVEYKWSSKTFLEQTCVKAGMGKDSWKDIDSCEVFSFQSQVFKETEPKGKVVQKNYQIA